MTHFHVSAGCATAPEELRFCPRCAARMGTREIGGRPRRACAACGYVHFVEPRVGVGALVHEAGRILLVRRAMAPERGRWAIPAGYLDAGEDPRVKAALEVLEETGLAVAVGALVDVFHDPPVEGGASLFILYRARVTGGRLQAGDDAAEARFFDLDALPDIAFRSTREAVRLLRGAAGPTHDEAGPPGFHLVGEAPTPVAPFSHAVEAGGWVFVTGQMPTHPDDDTRPLPSGVEAQTRRVMDNLVLVLHGLGLGLEHVTVARVYLRDFERDYAAMNAVYASYFPATRLPARTCVGVTGLARDALVEIDLIARRAASV